MEIKKILCPTDMSYNAVQAIKYAYAVADILSAELVLLHVEEDPNKVEKCKCEQELAGLMNALKNINPCNHVKFDIRVKVGRADEEIIDFAVKGNVDLVIMALMGSFLQFDSITKQVIDMSPCPVIGLPLDYSYKPIERIVYASDLRKDESESVDFAFQFAKRFEAHLDFLNIDTEENKEFEDVSRFVLKDLLSKVDYNDVAFHRVGGSDPASGISHFALSKKADLEVISSYLKSDTNGPITKNCTYQLIDNTSIPLLILHKNKSLAV